MKNIVFIHGILRRSGTNFLNRILLLHKDCVQPTIKIRENWYLHHSDSIIEYTQKLFNIWSNPKWGGRTFSTDSLYPLIGNSLISYLCDGLSEISEINKKTVVSKTPSVHNIQRIYKFFPYSKPIIIVRDPRDIAISTFKTWKTPFIDTLTSWQQAAQNIITFEKNFASNDYLLIRYEDLLANKKYWIQTCLSFLHLDEDEFPWPLLDELPIFGSSEVKSWEPQPANASFQPVGRWKSVPKEFAEKLSELTIPYMDYFGYAGSGILPVRSARLNMYS